MKLRAHSFYRRAQKAVREHSTLQKHWSGVVFRCVTLEFARPEQILDGRGAMKSGARWNPQGRIRALYCSLNPGTAAEESIRLFEAAGFGRASVKPRLIVGIRYRLACVVDLRKLIEKIEGVALGELMAEDWQKINAQGQETRGQALGRALFNGRIEGFLVPSARMRDATNLVIFPQNLRSASVQEIIQKHELSNWKH